MGDTHPRLTETPSRTTNLEQKERTGSLRGTLVSVLVLGGLIVASWLGIFFLYLSRNG